MSIATIRRYTDADRARVKATAERFAARHGIRYSAEIYDDAEHRKAAQLARNFRLTSNPRRIDRDGVLYVPRSMAQEGPAA